MGCKIWSGAVIAGLWVVGACSEAADEGSGEVIARGELAGRVARIYCDSLGGCCQGEGVAFDSGSCVQRLTSVLEQELNHLDGAAVTYDPNAAAQCLVQVESSATCGQGVLDGFGSCTAIFRGTVEELKPCKLSAECKQAAGSRSTCQLAPGEPSFCLSEPVDEPRHSIEGGDCSRSCDSPETCSAEPGQNLTCFRSDGRFCSGNLPFGICQPLVAVGAPCDTFASGPCQNGTFCDSATETCSPARAAGETCFVDEQCQSGKCTLAQVCSATNLDPADCSLH